YKDGEDFMFMDSTNYDQIRISKETVGDAVDYMLENTDAIVAMHEGNPLFIELPASVELKITYTEPGLKGDTATRTLKPATVETGAKVNVPLFVNEGELIRVNTKTGDYVERVKEA
ncbi:MAG: elongation factor P, partial [Cyclobacteriaceae bacterium]